MAEQTVTPVNEATSGEAVPGDIQSMVEVEGVVFTRGIVKGRPMKEHIECIRSMQMRDDDVIIIAYAKSGTHWLWEVGSMLLAGKAEYEKQIKEHVMMEFMDTGYMDKLPSPRLLNTHFPVSMLPRQVKDGKVKLLHVYRNPKDVCVSRYFHTKQTPRGTNLDMKENTEIFLSDKSPGGNYFTYMKEVDDFKKDNPGIPSCTISFEEMKADPKGTVRKLAKFLKVDASDELCDDIVDACSFQNLKEADKTKIRSDYTAPDNAKMYRKGEVGDWKNHLTVAASEKMDEELKRLEGCDYHFRFTL